MNELDLGPLRVEAEENPGSSVAVLLAEVDRLRADLAAAQRERDLAREALDNLVALHRALLLPTAGDTARTEGE